MALAEVAQPIFTRDDFTHGRPESLIQATESPRLLVVWPHADEHLGAEVGHHLYSQRPDLLRHVDYLCGNPRAASQDPQPRYTPGGTDLNRSYAADKEPVSYEEHRAWEIMMQVEEGLYDYVLDLHTATADVGRCMLVSEAFLARDAVQAIIKASPINNIIVMPDRKIAVPESEAKVNLVQSALIGKVPQSASVEYFRPLAEATGIQDTIQTIENLASGTQSDRLRERNLFYVDAFIPKAADPGVDAKNFELCGAGYYPVLYGERAYRDDPTKTYLGFAATRREVVTL